MNFHECMSFIFPRGDRESAMQKLNEFAIAKGAPSLKEGQNYGLQGDGTIVGLDREPLHTIKN